MNYRSSIVLLFSVLYFEYYAFASEMNSRHKRCIVVQKQSGTHGDSSEGDGGNGDEERQPQPRDSKADRRRVLNPLDNIRKDVEDFPPSLLKYRIPPTKGYPSELLHYLSKFYKNRL